MIQQFQTYLGHIKGLSYNTVKSYGKDLHAFASWVNSTREGARWSTIQQSDIDDYVIMMSKSGHKPATICRHISAISAFYRWAQSRKMCEDNPARYESRPKVERRMPHTLSVEAINKAIERTNGRMRVILCILKNTGARIQETLDIKRSDIDMQHNTIRLHGKGAKERNVYMNEELKEAIANCQPKSGIMLFAGISQEDVRYTMYAVLSDMQAAQKSPHAIRHSYASELARQGANVAQIATLLGHNDIRTTQKYIDMNNLGTQRIGTNFKFQTN